MLTELEFAEIADFLTNINDHMSWEEQASYLASEYGIESLKAKKLVEVYQNKFGLTVIVMEAEAIVFIKNFLLEGT